MLHSPRDISGILCTKWSKIKTSFFLRSTLKKKIVSKIKLICKPKNAFPTFNIAKYIVFTQTCCIFFGGRDTHFLQQNATHHPGHRPPIAQLLAPRQVLYRPPRLAVFTIGWWGYFETLAPSSVAC